MFLLFTLFTALKKWSFPPVFLFFCESAFSASQKSWNIDLTLVCKSAVSVQSSAKTPGHWTRHIRSPLLWKHISACGFIRMLPAFYIFYIKCWCVCVCVCAFIYYSYSCVAVLEKRVKKCTDRGRLKGFLDEPFGPLEPPLSVVCTAARIHKYSSESCS